MKKIAILTSKSSWFVPYARTFVACLQKKGYMAKLFFDHDKIRSTFDVVFVLSYHCIMGDKFLGKHVCNLVVHASALPKGKGWAPLFWQIIEGKNKIPVVLFEASSKVDDGPVYLRNHISLKGHELHDEIRYLLAEKTTELCLKFLSSHQKLKLRKQKGKATFYCRRTAKDSELQVDKSIKDQFNLLRTVNNKEFPAFFNFRGHKYIIHISKDD